MSINQCPTLQYTTIHNAWSYAGEDGSHVVGECRIKRQIDDYQYLFQFK